SSATSPARSRWRNRDSRADRPASARRRNGRRRGGSTRGGGRGGGGASGQDSGRPKHPAMKNPDPPSAGRPRPAGFRELPAAAECGKNGDGLRPSPMKRPTLLVLALCCLATSAAGDEPAPNLLFLFADDWGRHA